MKNKKSIEQILQAKIYKPASYKFEEFKFFD